jgi:hypothetical protein
MKRHRTTLINLVFCGVIACVLGIVMQNVLPWFSGVKKGLSFKDVVPLIAPRPALFIAAGNDAIESDLARRYAEQMGESAQVWIIPDVDHLGGILAHPDEYAARMLTFFNEQLSD